MNIMKKLMKILGFVKTTDSGQMKRLSALVRFNNLRKNFFQTQKQKPFRYAFDDDPSKIIF